MSPISSTLARRALQGARTPAFAPTLRTSTRAPVAGSIAARPFSSSQHLRSASSHEDHYDAPGGWLWGRDPSKQHEKEDWENAWTYGFFGAMAFLVGGWVFKPDTSIQTWALEEARRRLEAEGILADPERKG
ncbi:Hypothetical protein D9617_153g063420 [Elsinoe fawcettii]|nr:Hypothetical protein D9617_153g063420 [Elsinoe fawcettii]